MNRIVAATAIAVGLSSGPAHAVCSLADIGGTWAFYGDVYSGNQGSALALHCTLHIDKTDGKVAPESACQSTGVNGFRGHGTVTYGVFRIAEPDDCTFELRLGTNAGRNLYVEVRHATLSENKQIMAGMIGGGLDRNATGSIFTMVKIR